ncbi:MAG: MaoC family dehydratase [Nitrospinales bacterium]
MPDFDSIQVGDEATLTRTITEKDIQAYAALTGDDNSVHTNKQFAERTRFKQPIAHGMLTASLFSAIIGTRLPGHGSLYVSQDLNFKNPVMVDDIIQAKVKVVQKVESTKMIVLKTTASNQRSQVVLSGTAKVTWAF